MFFKKKMGTEDVDGYGRLYVMKFVLKDGTIVHKVGMCNTHRSVPRMMEILESFFNKYRYVPHVTLRKDKKVVAPLLVEQHMHRLLEEWSYRFDIKFDGSTEFFEGLDEEVLLDYLDDFNYRELLDGRLKMKTEDYNAISKELGKSKGEVKGEDELGF